ncbi:hypothetical protein MKX03_016607, partial [Papaver bracteatum]
MFNKNKEIIDGSTEPGGLQFNHGSIVLDGITGSDEQRRYFQMEIGKIKGQNEDEVQGDFQSE